MEKPTSIATRRVAVQYVIGAVDGPDADDEPDFIPARGVVEFTASVAYTPWPEVSGPNPMTVLNAKITGVLDDEGYLCTPHPSNPTLPGKRGVRLLCTDGSGGSVKEWTWTAAPKFVDANGTRIPDVIPPFSFYLPSDPDPNAPDLDLTTVVKVPASQGIGNAQAEALAALASAAAASSANSAETAVAAALDVKRRADAGEFKGEDGKEGAPGPNTVPTDLAVSLNMADPDTATGTALQSIIQASPAVAGKVGKGELTLNVKDYGAKGNGAADDTSAINAALAALAPGGVLYFPPGRYMTNGGHVVDAPSTKIYGASGRAQTYNSASQIFLRPGGNADMLTIRATQVTVRDLSLYGNKAKQTAQSRGIVTPSTHAANYLLLDAVWVDSFNGDGYSFQSSGTTLSSTITNCESRLNEGFGMRFYGTATDSMVANCYIDQNAQSGVYCTSGDLSLTSVHIWGNGTSEDATKDRDGITFQSASGCRVVNCYIETQFNGAGVRFKTGANKGHLILGCDIWSNGLQGIFAFAASNCSITGNVIRTNNYKGRTDSNGAGLVADSCSAMSITGNQFFSVGANRQTYGYYEANSAAGNVFMGNVSRASEHSVGNWVTLTGGSAPTLPALIAAFNVG